MSLQTVQLIVAIKSWGMAIESRVFNLSLLSSASLSLACGFAIVYCAVRDCTLHDLNPKLDIRNEITASEQQRNVMVNFRTRTSSIKQTSIVHITQ